MLTKLPRTLVRTVIQLAAFGLLLGSCPSYAGTAPQVTVLSPPVTKHVRSPLRISLDARGDYLVSDPRAGGVSRFTPTGQLVEALKTEAPPQGVALDDKGNLLVSQGDSVAILDQSGRELGRLGSGAGQFGKANGIAVDAAGFVYVADSLANNVKVFNSAGEFVQAIGGKGTGAGQFSLPTGVAYEKSANQIAVADTQNGRVQFFSAAGNFDFVKSIGSLGAGQLQFKTPVGVAFEYSAAGALSRMYVADTSLNTVQVIDPVESGRFLAYIGNDGLANGQLTLPMDVAFDQVNRRVIVVNGNGNLIMYGIDGGLNPAAYAPPALLIDPVTATVGSASVTISGTVEPNAAVVVTTRRPAVAAPVVYTSASTWKCSVRSLPLGKNVLTVTATDAKGRAARHSVGITYTP